MSLYLFYPFLQGHLAGPYQPEDLPWPADSLKYISLFGKQKAHSGNLRLINDHSSPPEMSFNDGIPDSVTDNIHLHMSKANITVHQFFIILKTMFFLQISSFVESLLLAGKGAFMSKHDLSEAFQIIAVNPAQYPYQVLEILGKK